MTTINLGIMSVPARIQTGYQPVTNQKCYRCSLFVQYKFCLGSRPVSRGSLSPQRDGLYYANSGNGLQMLGMCAGSLGLRSPSRGPTGLEYCSKKKKKKMPDRVTSTDIVNATFQTSGSL